MESTKVALITGANRGIGFETAKQLGEKGVTVIVGARTLQVAQQTAESLQKLGIVALGIQLDVTNAADRASVAEFIATQFGKLDILINNAGVGPADGLFVPKTSATTTADFEHVFGINLFSLIYLTHDLIPLLKKSDAGRIVNLSSILGSLTLHAQENSPIASAKSFAYNTSKTALNMFTIHLADELKNTKIKVNSAHPGWVKTEMGGVDVAELEIPDGAVTSVQLALIDESGPNGKFIHLGQELPW